MKVSVSSVSGCNKEVSDIFSHCHYGLVHTMLCKDTPLGLRVKNLQSGAELYVSLRLYLVSLVSRRGHIWGGAHMRCSAHAPSHWFTCGDDVEASACRHFRCFYRNMLRIRAAKFLRIISADC